MNDSMTNNFDINSEVQLQSLISTISRLQRCYNEEISMQEQLKSEISSLSMEVERNNNEIVIKEEELENIKECNTTIIQELQNTLDSISSSIEVESNKLQVLEEKYKWLKEQLRKKTVEIRQCEVVMLDFNEIEVQARRCLLQNERDFKEAMNYYEDQFQYKEKLSAELMQLNSSLVNKLQAIQELQLDLTNNHVIRPYEELKDQCEKLQVEFEEKKLRLNEVYNITESLKKDIEKKDQQLEMIKLKLSKLKSY